MNRVMTWAGKDYFKEMGKARHPHDYCPECRSILIVESGCKVCPSCGWSAC